MVADFLTDTEIGAKRLCSLPDRVTNTIHSGMEIACRPTVISCYREALPNIEQWWAQWKDFMFAKEVQIVTKTGLTASRRVCELLDPIKQSKYPAITEAEQACSISLQIIYLAAFDASLVFMMNLVAPRDWHRIKTSLMDVLHQNKCARVMDILTGPVYASCDVIFLQEVSAAMVRDFENNPNIKEKYHILSPETLDGKRDQNSIILAASCRFSKESSKKCSQTWGGEISAQIIGLIDDVKSAPVAAGDLFVVCCQEKVSKTSKLSNIKPAHQHGQRFIFASFHGDTDGLATIPVVSAVKKYMTLLTSDESAVAAGIGSAPCPPLLVFGMDANTYKVHNEGKRQGVIDFAKHLAAMNIATCWGAGESVANEFRRTNTFKFIAPNVMLALLVVDPNLYTTYNARTFLQPQLNKAVRFSDYDTSKLTDKNPKDHILFESTTSHLRNVSGGKEVRAKYVFRDNTGDGNFIADMPFPTSSFPSDHAIVCVDLELVPHHFSDLVSS